MNLKEAKEHLEKNGYKIQRLNECGYASVGGCGGWDNDDSNDDDSSSCGSSFSSRRNGCSGYSEPRRPSFTRRSNLTTLRDIAGATKRKSTSRASAAAKNALLRDLIEQIPDDKIETLIQLLKLLK